MRFVAAEAPFNATMYETWQTACSEFAANRWRRRNYERSRGASLLWNMTDVLVQFDEPQLSADGRMFIAQVLGDRLPTGLWAAWFEFHPRIGGDPVRTNRETEQLSRGDLRFWAAGVTQESLREALERALDSRGKGTMPEPSAIASDERGTPDEAVLETNVVKSAEPLLNPVSLYQRAGEYTLRQELRALDARQLADIIEAFDIGDMDVVDLARTYEDALAERIVASVQHNVARNLSNPGARVAEAP